MSTVAAVNGETKTEAKTQALQWLATQLRWERTLEELRVVELPSARVARAA